MILKALYDLVENGTLQIPVYGVGRSDWSDEDLHQHAREVIEGASGEARRVSRNRLREVHLTAVLHPGRLHR
jgi:glucose-6-phosphate 1-dehydrogenase